MTNKVTQEFKYLFVCANVLCGVEFGANRKDIKTCSDACRVALHRSKQVKKEASHLKRFVQSPFAYWLATNIKRAKTLEVIPRTLPALVELHGIYKRSLSFNGYGCSHDFAVCHISPVVQKLRVGTLHPQNLVIASAALNAGFGNKSFPNAGHSILKARLNPTLKVTDKTPRGIIIEKLTQYLGADLISRIVIKCNLQPSARQSLLDWFDKFGYDDRIPDNLHELKAPALRALKSEIEGKRAFSFAGFVANPNSVFCQELVRLSVYTPALAEVHDSFTSALPVLMKLSWELSRDYNKPSPDQRTYLEGLQDALHRQMFYVLHGADTEDFYRALTSISDYVQHRQDTIRTVPALRDTPSDSSILSGADWNPWDESCVDDPTAPGIAGGDTHSLVAERVTFQSTQPQDIPAECATFSDTDLEELSLLERQFAIDTHSECDDIPAFQTYKPKPKHQSAFARFLSG